MRWLLATILLLSSPAFAVNTVITATATVDASSVFTSTVKAGTLGHGFPLLNSQGTRNYTAMLPQSIRDGNTNAQTTPPSYATAIGAGASTYIQVLSDSWCYPNSSPAWCGRGTPPSDFTTFGAFMATIATNNLGLGIIYDGWNEPNNGGTWTSAGLTFTDFENTFAQEFASIRAVDPAAKFEGPTESNYNLTDITTFLNYCAANGIQLFAISWHELQSTPVNMDLNLPAHIAAIQALIPSYPTVCNPTCQIHVNEYEGQTDRLFPAEMLANLELLEGSQAVMKSCWNEDDGTSACNNGALDSLLSAQSSVGAAFFAARSIWWVQRMWGGMGTRLATTTPVNPNGNVAIISADKPDGNKGIRLLVGSFDRHLTDTGKADAITNVTVTLNNLNSSSLAGLANLDVQINPIYSAGETPMNFLPLVSDTTVAVSGNSATIVLPGIPIHRVIVVTVQDPAALFPIANSKVWPL